VISPFSEERKTWSRQPYRLRGIRCRPTECHKCAIRVRGSGKHHPSALSRTVVRKAICHGVERPRNHPMWCYGNRGTGFIRRIRVASLHGSAKHVNHSGHCIGRLRLSLHRIHHPSHTHGVHAHRVADLVLISRRANPLIRTFDQNGYSAIGGDFGDRHVFSYCWGPERRALVIPESSALSAMSRSSRVASLDAGSFRSVLFTTVSRSRMALVWPELVVREAAPTIVGREKLSSRFHRRSSLQSNRDFGCAGLPLRRRCVHSEPSWSW
jgi:hypothetical protein